MNRAATAEGMAYARAWRVRQTIATLLEPEAVGLAWARAWRDRNAPISEALDRAGAFSDSHFRHPHLPARACP